MTAPTRRDLMRLGAAAAAVWGVPSIATGWQNGDGESIRLWPGRAPGARDTAIVRHMQDRTGGVPRRDRRATGIADPVLLVRRPARPTGAAVLVLPGGGYGFLAVDNEGEEQAAWLNARGITAFILYYRLPAEGWSDQALVPLQDAQRAVRLIRAGAIGFGIDPGRVAVLGFSAGGHLAGSLATRHAERIYAPIDAADRLSARPDMAALIYPVVSMAEPFSHAGSRDKLLGLDAPADRRRLASVETRVDADTPPTFLAHAGDDPVVPVANSLALYGALIAAKRPAALHIFDEGGHGFGVRLPTASPASAWPDLLHAWGVRRGVFVAR